MDDMYSPDGETVSAPTKHNEEGKKRQELDREGQQKILDELQRHSHPLIDQSVSLYNIGEPSWQYCVAR
jgi:hypothetical protein